jgi:hypothetical protein
MAVLIVNARWTASNHWVIPQNEKKLQFNRCFLIRAYFRHHWRLLACPALHLTISDFMNMGRYTAAARCEVSAQAHHLVRHRAKGWMNHSG